MALPPGRWSAGQGRPGRWRRRGVEALGDPGLACWSGGPDVVAWGRGAGMGQEKGEPAQRDGRVVPAQPGERGSGLAGEEVLRPSRGEGLPAQPG
jgi:hypothetical protein